MTHAITWRQALLVLGVLAATALLLYTIGAPITQGG